MKILYFTPIPSPFQLDFINDCILEGQKSKIDFDYVFKSTLTKERKHWKNKGDFNYLGVKNIKQIWQYLDEINPEVIIITQPRTRISFIMLLWVFFKNKKYCFGPSELLNTYNRNAIITAIKFFIFKNLARKASLVFGIGKSAVSQYQKFVSCPVLNIPYSFRQSHLKFNLNKSIKEDLVFLYSGRLEPFRSPLETIKIFYLFYQINNNRNLKLIISGKGSLYKQCINLIEKYNLQSKIEWINDFKDWHDIHKIYGKAHVFLCLQKYSGWGLTIQEAMASKMGIIASNTVAAADDLILHNYNGFIVPNNSNIAILNAMQQYLDHPGLINIHGDRSLNIVKKTDSTAISKEFIGALKNIC